MNNDIHNIKHLQLPSDKSCKNILPQDNIIYLILRKHENWETKETFVSIRTICEEANTTAKTVLNSIKNLIKDGYIEVVKRKGKNFYKICPYDTFQVFSEEFLQYNDLKIKEKGYLSAIQKYMYFDDGVTGKITFSNKEIGELINISERSVYNYNKILEEKNLVNIVEHEDPVAYNERNKTKIFNIKDYCQGIVYILKNHHEQLKQYRKDINDNSERIKQLEKELSEAKRTINQLAKINKMNKKEEDIELIL